MGAKKKPAASGDGEKDMSTEQFYKLYKSNCQKVYEVPLCKQITEMWGQYQDEETDFTKFHIWDQIGWQGTRAIMDALIKFKYSHCKSIRLWKAGAEDEGVRSLCEYLKISPNVALVELLDNGVTSLGCEFIAKAILPSTASNVLYLKLDHNNFGSEGVKALAKGLN